MFEVIICAARFDRVTDTRPLMTCSWSKYFVSDILYIRFVFPAGWLLPIPFSCPNNNMKTDFAFLLVDFSRFHFHARITIWKRKRLGSFSESSQPLSKVWRCNRHSTLGANQKLCSIRKGIGFKLQKVALIAGDKHDLAVLARIGM